MLHRLSFLSITPVICIYYKTHISAFLVYAYMHIIVWKKTLCFEGVCVWRRHQWEIGGRRLRGPAQPQGPRGTEHLRREEGSNQCWWPSRHGTHRRRESLLVGRRRVWTTRARRQSVGGFSCGMYQCSSGIHWLVSSLWSVVGSCSTKRPFIPNAYLLPSFSSLLNQQRPTHIYTTSFD